MQFNRVETIFALITISLCLSAAFKVSYEEDTEEKASLPDDHQTQPRFFGIFSKPPKPDAPKQVGGNILGHVGNVLHGGSFGLHFEARPLGKLHDILGHVKKKFIPNHETVGKPEHEQPDEPPKNEHWEEDKEWEMKPEKPDPELPSWEDIGEDPEGYGTEVPIEEIIQPRLKPNSRPKRFVESKVYHVNLLFRSNGKPYQVVDRGVNSVHPKKMYRG